jgi:hypothetical protein
MRATWSIINLGNLYVIPRIAMQDFVELLIKAENVDTFYRERVENAPEPPKANFKIPLNKDRPRTYEELVASPNITIEPGLLQIRGAGIQVLQFLACIAEAWKDEPERFMETLNNGADADENVKKVLENLRDAEAAFEDTSEDEEQVTFLIGCPPDW